MADRLSAPRTGLVCAGVMAGWHSCWLVLVATGIAQGLVDFVFWMHFIRPIYVVEPFEPGRAAILIVATATVGFVVGAAFAGLWNAVHDSGDRGGLR